MNARQPSPLGLEEAVSDAGMEDCDDTWANKEICGRDAAA